MGQYEVQLINESMHEFYVMFTGPKESKLPPHVATLTFFSCSSL